MDNNNIFFFKNCFGVTLKLGPVIFSERRYDDKLTNIIRGLQGIIQRKTLLI